MPLLNPLHQFERCYWWTITNKLRIGGVNEQNTRWEGTRRNIMMCHACTGMPFEDWLIDPQCKQLTALYNTRFVP